MYRNVHFCFTCQVMYNSSQPTSTAHQEPQLLQLLSEVAAAQPVTSADDFVYLTVACCATTTALYSSCDSQTVSAEEK